ncbi:hypothetical protein AGABI1DRAFT_109034 [Agaricus bisporus var. burnettii JB137-S8]|uniref:TypA/BipA C-terminal domain-containing protein n=1 Tax=Agaricus bisporus var. burnettii (strain JB137-S8 / ATCC MYA-4627 / FGSC 10392) TaxID=597362 RepID=K5VNV4_AGABU|nr:uncharacterized protein AGABI1DRAFT_109034 [Agaricus bisporus var. burnettii JB137-S8]EKM76119.1 hypothetical protein AGABI1DRAFT_109034 [Agaricus bisporus var. burnettii JB137-S8]
MLSVQLEHDPYLGLLHLGRIHSGTLSVNDTIWAIDSDSTIIHDANRSTDNLRLDPPNRFALLGQRGHESDIPIHPPMVLNYVWGAPKAVSIPDEDNPGKWLEPVEECHIVVKDQYAGTVVEKLTLRKGMIANTGKGERGSLVSMVTGHINPCLKKQWTNFRTVMADAKVVLEAPRVMMLEEMLIYMSEKEVVEITPKSLQLPFGSILMIYFLEHQRCWKGYGALLASDAAYFVGLTARLAGDELEGA